MNTIAIHILTLLVSAGTTAAPVPANPLLTELVTKGVTMPDGQTVRLPEPLMVEGLTAEQQAQVLKEVAPRGNVLEFTSTQTRAQVSLKLGRQPANQGNDLIRTVDVAFVVYGSWEVLTSDDFSKSILKKDAAKGKDDSGTAVIKAGYLKTPEMAVRGVSAKSTSDLKEYILFTTFRLFGEVEVSATRFGVATKTPTGVVVAAMVDPRFIADKEYPNLWRHIDRDAGMKLGPPNLFPVGQKSGSKGSSGAGFYAKVTRLLKPADAIFVEYHSAFYEPEAWFGANNERLLPTQLKQIIPFQVQQFRIKLAQATKKAAEEKKAAGEKSDAKPAEATADK